MAEPAEFNSEQREAKAAVRRKVREVMARMAPTELAERSRKACERVIGSAYFACARSVMLYAPLPGELDTSSLIQECLKRRLTVCLPRVDWERVEMAPARIEAFPDGVVETKYGVREPRPGAEIVDISELDLVIVPGIAFDLRGGRLGRGAGFYDRFLATPGMKAIAIGVALDAQMVMELPMRGAGVGPCPDARMDAVLTESRVVLGV